MEKRGALTERIHRLKHDLIGINPEICIERAREITLAYRENEHQAAPIKRARALERILARMTISIREGELIAGSQASKPRAAPLFPEFSWDWIDDELDTVAFRKAD